MKFNKWTLGLAALGVVSMASAVRADEKLVPLQTAVSSTVLSGAVDIGAQYNMGNYSTWSGVPAGTAASKVDGFSLNNVVISLDKAQDESPWAAGYHVDLNAGTDAVGIGSFNSSGISAAVRQAYVVVRTPVGNGIDWKVGVQDDIIGYESNTDSANPNYTRSIGYYIEPSTLVGLVGSYKIVDGVVLQAGICNPNSGPVGPTGAFNSSDKTFAGSLALTAPDSWGWAKGATLTGGTLLNIDKGGQNNFYAGLTVPTPLSTLKLGAAFDMVSTANSSADNSLNDSGWVGGLYAVLTPTEKLSFNVRGEYYSLESGSAAYTPANYASPHTNGRGEEFTATLQYNLWANVVSRLEFRWDHADSGNAFANPDISSGNYPNSNSYLLAANLIYTF